MHLVSLECSQPTHGPLREGLLPTKAVKWAFVILPDWGSQVSWLAEGSCCPQPQVTMCKGSGWDGRKVFPSSLDGYTVFCHFSSPRAPEDWDVHLVCWGEGVSHLLPRRWGVHRQDVNIVLRFLFPEYFQITWSGISLLPHPVEVTTLGFCCQAIQGQEEIWKAVPVSQRWSVHNIWRANQILW